MTGGIVTVFKRTDDISFEIAVTLSDTNGVAGGVNRFVFSSDGRALVETKTQTLRGTTLTAVLTFERPDEAKN